MKLVMLTASMFVVAGGSSPANAQSAAAKAAPAASIPTIDTNNVARHGFFDLGGTYVGELGEKNSDEVIKSS
jgi:hypothetical protein